MKKVLVIILVLVMALCLFSCKKDSEVLKNGYEEIDLTEYVELFDYSTLSYEKPVVTVTDEEIQKEIDTLLKAKLETVYLEEGVVDEDSVITISYKGELEDGSTPDSMSSESFKLDIANSTMIEGFTESIIGHNVGDEFVADCVFPDPYTVNTDLSGKKAKFTIKVLNIVTEEVPELTDAWVKENTDYKSIEKLKEGIKTDLEAEKLAEKEDEIKTEIYKKLIEGATIIKMNDEKVEAEMEVLNTWFKNLAILNEQTWEEYMSEELGYESQEEYEAKLREDSETIVEYDLKVYAYAQKEGVEVSQEDYDTLKNDILTYYGMDDDDDFLSNAAITIQEYIHLTGYDLDLYANAFVKAIYEKVVK